MQQAVAALLREGAACEQAETAKTCEYLLTVEAALWTFVSMAGVEPTNDAAERVIRPAVLRCKRSVGPRARQAAASLNGC